MSGAREIQNPRLVPFIIGAALFMQSLDVHAVGTLLPSMAQSLAVSAVDLNLAITGFYIGAALLLPVTGWCADRFGARTVFQVAIVVFATSSAVCSFADTVPQIFAARTVQGMAGAGLMPVGRLVLVRTSERSELVQRLTWLTVPPMLGPLLGPVVAGALGTYGSWRWMFLANVPIGLVGLVLISRYIPNLREETPRPLDLRGVVLSGAGLALGVFALERMGHPGLAELFLLVCALGFALAYAFHARRTEHPVLDLGLLRLRSFAASTIGGLFFRLSVGAEPFLLATLFQIGFGLTALASGCLIVLSSLGAVLMKSTAPRLIRHFGFRRLLVVNGLLCALTLGLVGVVDAGTPLALVGAALLGRGFFKSLQLSALNTLAYADPPRDRMSSSASLAATIQQVAQALSAALAATLIAAAQGLGQPMSPGGVQTAILVLCVLSLASLPLFLRMPPDAGAAISGRKA